MIYYMVILDDKHTDPCYWVFKELKDAIVKAEEELDDSRDAYKLGPEGIDRIECDGGEGFHFSAGGDDGFWIYVREIEVPNA